MYTIVGNCARKEGKHYNIEEDIHLSSEEAAEGKGLRINGLQPLRYALKVEMGRRHHWSSSSKEVLCVPVLCIISAFSTMSPNLPANVIIARIPGGEEQITCRAKHV